MTQLNPTLQHHLTDLPDEILVLILAHVNTEDIVRMRMVSSCYSLA